jgi:hypothetical protein
MTHDEYEKRQFDVPSSKLERFITSANAAHAVECAERIEELFLAKLPRQHAMELKIDHWSTSVREHDA